MAGRLLTFLLMAVIAAWPAAPLGAQSPGTSGLEDSPQESAGGSPLEGPQQEIVVTGTRYPTALLDTIPDTVVDSREIRALGESNIGDLLGTLSPQTRGAAGAGPIILLNGRRISGFSEVSSLPPEAVDRIDVLREEVALRYGYGPGSRVVNIVLLPRYAATVSELEQGAATEGGRSTTRAALNLLRIRESTRWNVDAQYQRETSLLESERRLVEERGEFPFDIAGNVGPGPGAAEIDPGLSALSGRPISIAGVPAAAAQRVATLQDFAGTADLPNFTDTREFRTLLPARERLSVNGTVSGFVFGDTSATLNLRAEGSDASSLLGLAGGALLLPGQSSFSPFASTATLYRSFDAPGALVRKTENRLGHAGLVLNGAMASWFWSFTANYDRVRTRSVTDGGVDVAALQARLDTGDTSFYPLGPLPLAALPPREKDVSRSSSSIASAELVAYGPILALPAGPLSASLTAAGQTIGFHSRASAAGVQLASDLSRQRGSLQAVIEIPIASPTAAGLSGLGTLSVDFSIAVSNLSDFGTIRRIGAGMNWAPARPLSLSASYTDEDRAPSVEQLGDPLGLTPNVRLFDFTRGDTVAVTRIDGGNRDLARANRRLLKLGVLLKPLAKPDLSIRGDYSRIRERNMIGAFPAFTTELEPGFPDRFQRDADGRLLRVDARPINFARAARDELRWGVHASAPVRFGPGRNGGGGAAGQFDLALFHTWVFRDRATLRANGPVLDFVNGSAAGSVGGRPRHQLELQAGLYRNGLGARISANAQSATSLRSPAGGSGGGREELAFGRLATANLRLFADLGQQPKLVRGLPWLQNARVTLAVSNLFDSRMKVRDRIGITPSGYQPAFLDPVGRSVSLSLRKLFS